MRGLDNLLEREEFTLCQRSMYTTDITRINGCKARYLGDGLVDEAS